MIEKISGFKTYILSAGLFFLGGAYAMGWIDEQAFYAGSVMLGGGTASALRSGISKSAH